MCGITGIARFDGVPVDRETITAMAAALIHRGPDDTGHFVEGNVGLGMRRLAIIDLSPLGHQPMANETGSVQLAFNGEVYNFRDLRSSLSAQGHVFRSTSDTEVLVHGYEQFGAVGLASRLEGMFAFAIVDRASKKLFLGRDHFGVKPLYLRRRPGRLSFASEIRALALDGTGSPGIDAAFVGPYLCLGYVPSPRTAFRGVEKLAPGVVLEVDLASGQERTHRYYQLIPATIEDQGERALLQRLREALGLAVRRQLVADVPVGVFLSGGLDSSTLVALAARFTSGTTRTFTMGFASSDRGDETSYAAQVASATRVENTEIRIAPPNLHDLEPIVESLEEPLADSAVLPLWHLCKGTSRYVKVALSGEGGDEALGGYNRYFWGPVASRLASYPTFVASAVERFAGALPSRTHGPFDFARRARKLAGSARLAESQRYLNWLELFAPSEREELYPGAQDTVGDQLDHLFARAKNMGLDAVQRAQYVDFHTMLLDNLLLKSDKLSMAHSLEVRVPMLDRPLAELGLGLPIHSKVGLRGGKVLLRRFVRSELPRVISRRGKRGFEIPVDQWFRERANADLCARLPSGALVSQLGFSARGVAEVISRHLAGEDLGRQVFALLALDFWARRYCA